MGRPGGPLRPGPKGRRETLTDATLDLRDTAQRAGDVVASVGEMWWRTRCERLDHAPRAVEPDREVEGHALEVVCAQRRLHRKPPTVSCARGAATGELLGREGRHQRTPKVDLMWGISIVVAGHALGR